jgi:hypothetical protein
MKNKKTYNEQVTRTNINIEDYEIYNIESFKELETGKKYKLFYGDLKFCIEQFEDSYGKEIKQIFYIEKSKLIFFVTPITDEAW